MPEPLLIGIDVGTSVVKSVVFDRDGNQLASAHRIPEIRRPKIEFSEADMDRLWQDVLATLREVVADDAVDPSAVLGLGVSGTCCSSWLLDDNGAPVRSAILWNDGRAADIVHGWQDSGLMDRQFAVSGNVIFPGYTVAVLRWLKDNEPETLRRARHSVFCKDWIRFRLTGEIATDHSDSGSLPYDIRNGAYSEEIFEACGIAEAIALLPKRVLDPGDVAGHLLTDVAAETGLPPGLPVVAGMMDVAATALGAGATRPGQACSIVGTSFLNCFVTDMPTFEPAGTGVQMKTVGGKWLRAMVNTAGTLNLDWFLKEMCASEIEAAAAAGEPAYAWAEARAASVPAGSEGIVYHPYLNNAGVVSPFFHPAARAQFFGLSVGHTKAHLLRAIYEGTALSMKDCGMVMPIEIDQWLVAGGGSRSAFWCQMFADCTGRRISVPQGTELGARGVAMLAGIATGVYSDLDDAVSSAVRIGRSYDPDPKLVERYARLFELYRSLHEKLRPEWWQRHDLLRSFAEESSPA